MKKLILSLFILICLVTLTAGADTPFLNFEFGHGNTENLVKGDTVDFTFEINDIQEPGLSSIEMVIVHSDGIKFDKATAEGLVSGWTIWDPNVSDGTVKLAIVDDTVVTPGLSDITLTVSFTVDTDEYKKQSVKLSELYIYDFDINEVTDFSKKVDEAEFFVNTPEYSLVNKGASLRVNNTPALRFGAQAVSLPSDVSVGMLYCKTSELYGELTHSAQNAKALELKQLSGDVYVTDAVGFESNTEKFTFRPYVEIINGDGSKTYVYYDTLERSAEQVALAELESGVTSDMEEKLKGFCSNT